jgi:hypothetical protein
MENKEKIYDEQIAPLMAKIIEICKAEEIPMFAEVQYADLDFCTTFIYPDVDGRNVALRLFNVLSQCRTEEGVNFDKFVFHVARNFDNASSIVLNMLGKKPKSELESGTLTNQPPA